MKKEKLVSVIIPCHNAAKWLPQCFMSLVKQSIGIENIELIFVDDASNDDGATLSLLAEMERAYPENILVISLKENLRQGGARNVALGYASGKYIAFVDADDFVSEDFLKETVTVAEKYSADIVQFGHFLYMESGTKIEVFGKTEGEKEEEVILAETEDERKAFLVGEKLTYGCWNKLYLREMVIKAGAGFAEKVIYEEPLFVYPLLFEAKRIVHLRKPYYYYRQNNLGTMRKDMEAKATLFEHPTVQQAVLEFMKTTPYFTNFREEIKLYYLHTYLYETLFFASKRGIKIEFEEFKPLIKQALSEFEDIDSSIYEKLVPKQMELYRLIKRGIKVSEFEAYRESL